jgi:signal transduction histidine kinase
MLAATLPAHANLFNTTGPAEAPLALALGAAALAAIAAVAVKTALGDSRQARQQADGQVAGLRAQLDEYEGLLSGAREITVLWNGQNVRPRIFGQVTQLLPAGRRSEALLDFSQWLSETDGNQLARAIEALRVHGEGFALNLLARDGQAWKASGALLGGGAVLRLRPRTEAEKGAIPLLDVPPCAPDSAPDLVHAAFAALVLPAFRRDAAGKLTFANAAYQALTATGGTKGVADLVAPAALARHLATIRATGKPFASPLEIAGDTFDLVEFVLGDGTAGYLQKRLGVPKDENGRLAATVAALSVPAAVFDAKRQLIAFNAAYAELWQLGDWLTLGLDERAILDRLRRDGRLPSEPDYHVWRTKHFASYQLKAGRTVSPWHLPQGRTLNVTAAPAGPEGGVIYLYEDISRELELVSQNRALADVQRSTLNALSDAVAVFGTNGKLQLFNPRLSALWRLPINLLERNPHIDQLAALVAKDLPEDGATIWRDLKRAVIDLTPTRSDISGRMSRSDGRLIDYAVIRLPDGQKLMTFLDVTESASYSKVLQERNEALVTADRLKDAFVQNVSYELRSPLTNIIGFADLLASRDVGPLNAKQRAYTDYIRASSVTLGVLIDNILDLATVDAGIAELRPEPQDVADLVDKARAGLAATFPQAGGGTTVNLKVDIAPGLPPFIADGTRIVQVLYNLLSSAARFSEPGGEISLAVSSRGERMVFTIEDEGSMSEEVRAELLDRPERLAGRERGAGLGLSIVRAFVNLHGGTISVEQRKPRGNRVVINLPRDASSAASTAAE